MTTNDNVVAFPQQNVEIPGNGLDTEEMKEVITDESYDAKLDKFAQVLHTENAKKSLSDAYQSIQSECASLRSSFKSSDDVMERIENELRKYSMDDLQNMLKNNDNVQKFFVDPCTGEPLKMAIDVTKDREIEFKRGYLVYIKSSQEAFDKIDKEFEELDRFTKEINIEIQDAVNALSDNVLAYINMMTDKANAMTDESQKKRLLTTLKYLKSGYDMAVFAEVLDKYPTVAAKCISELEHESTIQNIGKRYTDKLQRNNIKPSSSLVRFASDIDNNVKSFEEIMLIRGDQYIVPDLFVYSLIRFFAMADWSDGNIRKAHASISLVIDKLLRREFEEELKNNITNSIVEYLSKFPTN